MVVANCTANDPTPPDMTRRPVTRPIPMWTWSLVWRKGEPNPSVPVDIAVGSFVELADKLGA